MPKRKKLRPEDREHEEHHRPKRDHPAAEKLIFSDLLERRLGGGAPPTPEAYANAMRQWQQLPGAVQFVNIPSFPSKPQDKPGEGEEPK